MKCPFCGNLETKVINSRQAEDGYSVRRRRECFNCKKRFTTYENIEKKPIIVIKRDGNRQIFDRNKIINGIIKSCEKRPISSESIDITVNNIEKKVENIEKSEITSKEIGELVMDELKNLDEVAYVRFASVYREFKDVQSFLDELKNIVNRKL